MRLSTSVSMLGSFPGLPTVDRMPLAFSPGSLCSLPVGILVSSTVSPLANRELLTLESICSCGLYTPWAALNLLCHWCICRLGGLNNRSLFSHSSGGWKSKIRVSAGWFLLRPVSLACRWPSSPCVPTWSSFCVCVQISFIKTPVLLD